MTRHLLAGAALLALVGCGESAKLPPEAGVGPNPQLPAPRETLFPTVNIAEASGWTAGEAPVAASGLRVNAFASGLDHPRWLLALPNGDVLVAETNRPKPQEGSGGGGIRGFFQKLIMGRAGANAPSADRITLLRDADGDGVAEVKTPFATGLTSPFGMALVGSTLYVANADALVALPYTPGATSSGGPARRIVDLPAGRNHHWTKSLTASPDGKRLYVGVGSNSNVAEHGLAEEQGRAAVWEIDPATGQHRIYASGLRNPVGLAFAPGGPLHAVVNERDEIGSDLVPDYITSVKAGGFYGWPWSYWGQHVDTRVEPARPDLVTRAIRPDYGLGSHVAPLGLAFARDSRIGDGLSSGAFVGLHGSWNRTPRSGYKVVFIPFRDGRPAGAPIDILGSFVDSEGKARGRPAGVEIAGDGALLVADDVGNVIWRVSNPRAGADRPVSVGGPSSTR